MDLRISNELFGKIEIDLSLGELFIIKDEFVVDEIVLGQSKIGESPLCM
jgi:hypothetical protein